MYIRGMAFRPLDQRAPLGSVDAAAVGAALASAVAELHAGGFVHGGLAPDRVLVDEGGVVSLLPAADPAPVGTRPADDLPALGTVLAWLATRAPDRPPPSEPGLLRLPEAGAVLTEVARRLQAPDAADRPSAGQVAELLHRSLAGAPPAPTGSRGRAAANGGRGRLSGRRRRLALGSMVAVGLVGAAAGPARCTASSPASPGDPGPGEARARWADGVLTLHGRRYAVGGPGDHVLVDRWECGPSAVALLQGATGHVVAFDRLPDHGEHSVGRLLARVPGAVRLEARHRPDGCTALAVVPHDGPPIPVPWEEAS